MSVDTISFLITKLMHTTGIKYEMLYHVCMHVKYPEKCVVGKLNHYIINSRNKLYLICVKGQNIMTCA